MNDDQRKAMYAKKGTSQAPARKTALSPLAQRLVERGMGKPEDYADTAASRDHTAKVAAEQRAADYAARRGKGVCLECGSRNLVRSSDAKYESLTCRDCREVWNWTPGSPREDLLRQDFGQNLVRAHEPRGWDETLAYARGFVPPGVHHHDIAADSMASAYMRHVDRAPTAEAMALRDNPRVYFEAMQESIERGGDMAPDILRRDAYKIFQARNKP